jgi:hypothetical protein
MRVTKRISRIVIRRIIISYQEDIHKASNEGRDHKDKQNCDQKDNQKLARRDTIDYH